MPSYKYKQNNVTASVKVVRVTAKAKVAGPPGTPGKDGLNFPSGGSTGQLLAKKSNADYDFQYLTVNSPVDATNTIKGLVKLSGDLGGTADSPTITKTYTKSDVGLSNVDNTSDANKPVSSATQTALNAKANTTYVDTQNALNEKLSNKGTANGYVPLGSDTKIAAAYLPSYVDDVIEYNNATPRPVTGETGKIYVNTETTSPDYNKEFRWSGSVYIEISASPGSTDAVPEGTTNLYYTNARASAAAPVQSVAGKTGAVTINEADVTNLVNDLAAKYSSGNPVPDATTTAKGILQLAGDLGGTAASPTTKNKFKVIDITEYGAIGDNSTDNTTFITNAITAANTLGVPVYIPPGIFQTGRISVPSGTKIMGADKWKSVIKRKAGANNYVFQNVDTTNGNINIVLESFTVDGNWTNQTAAPYHWLNWQNVSFYTIRNMNVTNSGNTRLRLASFGNIDGNTLRNAITTIDTVAFSLEEGSMYNRVSNNETYHYCNSVNIYGSTVETAGNSVTNNNFHDDGYYDGYLPVTRYGDAILVGGAMTHGNTITGNTIANVGEEGIRFTDNSYDNTATGNNITKTGRHGISLNQSVINTSITGNTIKNSGTTISGDTRTVANGVFVDITSTDNDITSNVIKGATQDGIQITSGSIRNNLVGNQIYGVTRYGIYSLAHNTSMNGNKIYGNGITQNGIFILNARNNNITGGSVASMTTNGIRIENNTTPIQTKDTVIIGVRAYDDQSTRTQGVGINIVATNGYAPDSTTIAFCDVNGNLNANITDAGTNSNVYGNPGYNPETAFDLGSITGSTTINRQNGEFQKATLTGNVSFTFTNGKGSNDRLYIKLTQDSTGSRTVTWPTNVSLAQGGLTLSSPANSVDVISFQWDVSASTWYEISRALATAMGSTPTGSAGGDLSGTYPNPNVPGLATKKSIITPQLNKTVSFTAAYGNIYTVDATSGNVTVTLPTSSIGQEIQVKKLDANAATGATSGIVILSGTINGTASTTLNLRKKGQAKQIVADGSGGWLIALGDLDITQLGASTTEQGFVQLTNDLGGTNTAPTTPTAVHLAGAETITGIKTFTANPKIAGIIDSNNANILLLPSTASAVNYVSITNSATGNPVTISSTGTDTNVPIVLTSQGSGYVGLQPGSNANQAIRYRQANGSVIGSWDTTNKRLRVGDGSAPTSTLDIVGDFTLQDASNVIIGTTAGTKIGTSTTQKIAFFNSTPVVQPTNTAEIGNLLSTLGLRANGGTWGATTSGNAAYTGNFRFGLSSPTASATLTSNSPPYQMVTPSSGSVTLTLPSTTSSGMIFTVKKVDSSTNNVIVKAGTSGTIDGSNTYTLSSQNKYVSVVSTNTSDLWYVIVNN